MILFKEIKIHSIRSEFYKNGMRISLIEIYGFYLMVAQIYKDKCEILFGLARRI
jgi:hypothetical protein